MKKIQTLLLLFINMIGVVSIAQTINGSNYGGTDFTPPDGAVLAGTFTNIGTFRITAGTTVFVANGTPLSIQANTIIIDGALNGNGSGYAGGASTNIDSANGLPGAGTGAGAGGLFGPCVHGDGGAGGGYGGNGGNSGSLFGTNPIAVLGGNTYGTTNTFNNQMGSGGGAGANYCQGNGFGGAGGAGGAGIYLQSNTITVSSLGSILADGNPGMPGTVGGDAGGGGGSGGTIEINCTSGNLSGVLSANGGDGFGPTTVNLYEGGGGGGGGRIKIGFGVITLPSASVSVNGGIAGLCIIFFPSSLIAQNGQSGTIYGVIINDITIGPVPATNCPNSTFSLDYVASGTFNAANTFIAQLSDALGGFASPVDIGSVSSTTSGSINATIPANVIYGTGYRIRVVSDNPVVTGADNGTDLTVGDNQVPALTCPGNQTLNVIPNTCAANYAIADPIADNCTGATWGYVLSGATTGTVSGIADGTGSGTLSFNKGVTTVTLSGTDGTNTATTCSFTVTVNDNQLPAISCPANINVNADLGQCCAVVNFQQMNTITYNQSFVQGQTASSTACSAWNTFRGQLVPNPYTKVTMKGSLNIIGVSMTNPTAIAQLAQLIRTATNGSVSDGNHTWYVRASAFCGGCEPSVPSVEVGIDNSSFCACNTSMTMRPNHGNRDWGGLAGTNCIAPSQTMILEFEIDEGNGYSISDNCTDPITVTQIAGLPSGSCFPVGTTTNTLQATDAAGNSSTCSFTVTVNDNQPPIVTCPDNQTINVITNTCAANYAIADPISDNCTGATWGYVLSGATTASVSGIVDGTGSGTLSFNKGITTVTLSGTDGTSTATACSFTVTVNDNQPPIVICPNNETLNVIANTCAANYTIANPISDNCTGVTWGYVLSGATTASVSGIADGTDSGTLSFNKGVTTVTLNGTDGTNAATTCSFTVTVVDNEDPTITCPVAATGNTNDDGTGNCTTTVSLGTPITGDNCHVASVKAYIGTTEIDPVTHLFAIGQTTVTWKVTDDAGNTAQCDQIVTITDNEDPTIICPADSPYTKSTNEGLCTYKIVGTEFDAIATDNCDTPTLDWDITGATTNSGTGSMADVDLNFGENTIAWTATDTEGNESTCSITVNVNKVTTTTAVTVTPIAQQYSDKVSFQATVTPFDCNGAGAIGGKVVFKIGDLEMGEADVVSGIAILSDVSLVEDHIYDDDSSPTHGPLQPDSNSKTVTAHFVDSDTDYNVIDATTDLTINCEDADVSYNGQSYFTVNPNNLSGTVVLSNYVVDKNDGANTRGDIRNATATFENGIWGTVLGTNNLRVGLVNPLNFQEGFVSTSFNTILTSNEASNGGRVYDVYSRVNNYYCGATDGITPVTLAMPGADYVTGGGHLVLGSNSSGKYAGTLAKKMNFGFVMKWNKSGKNLQGRVNVIYRRVDNGIPKVYQIKGTAIASLVVENVNDDGSPATGSAIKFRRATIVTKANLTDVTNPLAPISLGGNYDLVMTAWESTTVNTGTLDRVGVQLSGTGSIGLLFSSNWVSGKTVAQTISGGKVQVRNSSTAISAKTVNDLSIIKEKTNKSAELTPFSVKAYPNPSHNEFSLIVEGSGKEKIEVMVYDIFGRMVSHIKNSDNNFIRFGKELPFGYYIAIVKQGNNQETIKLIKLE